MQQAIMPDSQVQGTMQAKTKKKDWNLVFLIANTASVVFSYWLAGLTDMASNAITKPARIFLILVSIYYLFAMTRRQTYYFKGDKSWVVWIFIVLNLYVLPFSFDTWKTVEKFVNLFPYMVYVNYLIIYLYRNYDSQQILTILLRTFNLIYAFPIVAYLLSGSGLKEKDIYGETVGGFFNNHYGWACTIFLSTGMDLLRNDSALPTLHRRFILAAFPIALYILLISGSRSGYLSCAICFLIFVIRNRGTHIVVKFLTVALVTLFVVQMYGDKDSALNRRLTKTEKQMKEGEARIEVANLAFDVFKSHPVTMVTGFGFYAFRAGVMALNPSADYEDVRTGVHNSYYELMFGSGIFVFTFFIGGFIMPSLIRFLITHSARYTFLPPLILIPFFESNFNPGQFLFYPWFIIMFFYIHYKKNSPKISDLMRANFPATAFKRFTL